jgi:hypothetical protein
MERKRSSLENKNRKEGRKHIDNLDFQIIIKYLLETRKTGKIFEQYHLIDF